MKTVRFTEVVATSGRPQIHLSWTPPERDKALQSALKQHRVLTVHQHTRGAKKDFAVVGLDVVKDAQFLVFKKSLRRFEGRHVVGIHYELLADALSVGPTLQGRAHRPREKLSKKPDNVVPFRVEESEEEPRQQPIEAPRPAAKPKARKASPASKPPEEIEDTDPVKREIRRALDELASGRKAGALRRLEALLKS